MPDISVVIPTFNRFELLGRCLGALNQQSLSRDRFEVLVCDDAAEKMDSRLIQNLIRNFRNQGLDVRYLPVCGNHGPAAARNTGWKAADSEWVAFTDDDTIPDRNWLAQALSVLKIPESQWIAAVGQTIVPLPEFPSDYEKNESGLERAEFITANCFCRKSALEAVGGFDESFTMAWREDSDLHFKLINDFHEQAIGRIPSARVVHPVRPAPWGVCLKQAKKALFNALLYKKHPDHYRKRIQARPPLNYYAMVFSLLAAVAAQAQGHRKTALGLTAVWGALTVELLLRRLTGTRRDPSHVLELLATTPLIPPTAIFWRLYGAYKFQVLFL